jgi:hypothetical protein
MKLRKLRNALVPVTAAVLPGETVHFLHIAKTGGTAIKAALQPTRFLGRVSTPTHCLFLRDHRIFLKDIPAGQKVIFGVRDPARRFVSGFYSRLRGGKKGRNTKDAAERAVFDRFKTPRDLARDLYTQDPQRREAAQQAINTILHTRVRLTDWLGSPEQLARRANDVLYVYQQETLEADFDELKHRLSFGAVHLPADEVSAHKLRGGWDTSLDDLALKNLHSWYQADYEIIAACEKLFTGDGRMRSPPQLSNITQTVPRREFESPMR